MRKQATMIPRAWLDLELRDRSGKVLFKKRGRAHSWVRNFYNMLFGNASCTPSFSTYDTACRDTGGGTRSNINYICSVDGYQGGNRGHNAGLGYYSSGIQVDSGNMPWDFEQYRQYVIYPGTDPGRLSYQECERISTETVGLTTRTTYIQGGVHYYMQHA